MKSAVATGMATAGQTNGAKPNAHHKGKAMNRTQNGHARPIMERGSNIGLISRVAN
jgi:hypothetical protein